MHILEGKKSRRRDKETNIFDGVYSKRNIHHISEFWGFVVIGVIIILGLITRYNLHDNMPKALGNSDLLHNPNAFIAERAWKDLKILTSFGPRPAGTYSNEILAVDFLKREIAYIKQTAHRNQRIEMDLQVVSGGFAVDFKPHILTSVYRNVQNIVVKLHGQSDMINNNTLLINCHFDTVPGSPGASDNAGNCVIMLEVLRVLSRSSKPNMHAIIFLFNGAEETGLQAAHGFITQHKWATDIKGFLNLESAGSGGKEMLFQSSINNSWLLQMYGKFAPYPFAQVVAEEVFQSGLIPSDTDFRIFRDFGLKSGLDLAHSINSYRYHTKFDHIDYIPRDSLQHTGENLLELSKAIANSVEFGDSESETSPQVYFDIFGIFFIVYSVDYAIIFNYTVVTAAVLIPYFMLSKATKGINKKHLRFEIFSGFLINMISLLSSNALCYAIAYDLDLSGKSMTWYTHIYMCLPTYCLATVFVQCVTHLLCTRNNIAPLSLALQTQTRLIGTCFFWAILAAALTGAGIRGAYTIVVPLLITLISNITIGVLSYQNTLRKWLYVHLLGQVFVILWCSNFYNLILDIFIPTSGRVGGNKNPDIMIAIICSTMTFYATSYLSPLVILFKNCKNFLIALFATYIITRFYFIAFTNYGFPYSDDSLQQPRIQRHYITHTIRTLYDKEGNIRYTDSGFWLLEMDRNARKTIDSLTMPHEAIPHNENILCKNEVFCGLPLFSSRQLLFGGYWVPGPAPEIQEVAHFKLVSHDKPTLTSHRMNFLLTGSHQISLQIRLKDSVSIEGWSLTKNTPLTTIKDQQSYFVMITHGLESEPFNITLNLKTVAENHKRALLDITVVTHHFEYHKDHTSIFANMLAKLPRWAHAVPSVASLKSWTF